MISFYPSYLLLGVVGVVSSRRCRSSKYCYCQGLGFFTAIVGVGGQFLEVVSDGTVTGLVFSL